MKRDVALERSIKLIKFQQDGQRKEEEQLPISDTKEDITTKTADIKRIETNVN